MDIMKHAVFAAIVLVALLLLLGKIVNADNENRPDYVQIFAVEYAGSGCKDSGVTAGISDDFSKLHVSFSPFSALLGSSKSDRRKFCQVALDIRYSEGWQYSLADVDFSISSKLDSNIEAELGGLFYFQGDESEELKHLFSGPVEFTLQARVPLKPKWSSCEEKRALNIKGTLKVGFSEGVPPGENDERRGELTLNSPATFGIKWQRCGE